MIVIAPIYAELYQDFNGRLISEDEYLQRVNICHDILEDGQLPQNTDCMKYALSEQVKLTWTIIYGAAPMFDDFLKDYKSKN